VVFLVFCCQSVCFFLLSVFSWLLLHVTVSVSVVSLRLTSPAPSRSLSVCLYLPITPHLPSPLLSLCVCWCVRMCTLLRMSLSLCVCVCVRMLPFWFTISACSLQGVNASFPMLQGEGSEGANVSGGAVPTSSAGAMANGVLPNIDAATGQPVPEVQQMVSRLVNSVKQMTGAPDISDQQAMSIALGIATLGRATNAWTGVPQNHGAPGP
jgi:hypothetical protein